ncbi:AbiH family protein [Lactiplantibacillus plantarum]|uniref:AbiH family protein n=1 Tax=Lactiplantibacillus plantarum TaxID=1590 RepID=UPI00136C829D|nr:AbiH family protein [Lactiplantibacillus plantarum]
MPTTKDTKQLIIIGNGFDLHCDLKSNFNDYFQSRSSKDSFKQVTDLNQTFKELDSDAIKSYLLEKADIPRDPVQGYYLESYDFTPDKISFWDYYFCSHRKNNYNWSDVEYFLTDFFGKTSSDSKNIFKELETDLNSLLSVKNGQTKSPQFNPAQYEYEAVLLCCCNYDLSKHSEQYLSDFLFNELKKFETNFKKYLQPLADDDHYKTDSHALMSKLNSTDENSSFNLLTFNYTIPDLVELDCHVKKNIHSSLNKDPIIGIDSSNLSPQEPAFRFTKTYRIMNLANETSDMLLPKSIKLITFYGHSLAEADYAYFQSIFDYFDIYKENITLVFYYSVYDPSKALEIKSNVFNSVSKLLATYGDTFHNEKGKNLMHKLLLEGRLLIEKLPE